MNLSVYFSLTIYTLSKEEETYLHFNDMNYSVEEYLKIWGNISIAGEKWIRHYSNWEYYISNRKQSKIQVFSKDVSALLIKNWYGINERLAASD